MRRSLVLMMLAVALLAMVQAIVQGPIDSSAAGGRSIVGQTFTTTLTESFTSTIIYSYTVTSYSTSFSTTPTTTTATQIIVSTSTTPTTTTTTATSTSWVTQAITSMVTRTTTDTISLTSQSTETITGTSTSFSPTITVTSVNASYVGTTVFSPTLTAISVHTSVIPAVYTLTSSMTKTITSIVTVAVTRLCVIASAAYGSELAPQVQFLREFRDGTVMTTFVGSQFMRVFNAFYYSFSPALARSVSADPVLAASIRSLTYPLLLSLQLPSAFFHSVPMGYELVVMVVGVLASGLIGVIYASPLVIVAAIRRKSCNRGSS